MKKILAMSTLIAASITSVNAGMMPMQGYGMPQSGFGMSGMGMNMPGQQQGMGMGMSGMGMGMPQQGGSSFLTQEVKNSILQKVMNNPNLSQDTKGEAAFAVALGVSLDEAIICLTFGQNGQIFRLHSTPQKNGIVTDQGDIQNYNNILMQAKNSGGTATVQASFVTKGQTETFAYDGLAIDPTHLVIVRRRIA